MSEIKAIIYTSTKEDTTDNLVFENEDIIAISTNSKIINDIENPEFDIFPNSGTLTVKDKKLVIYNKALNGAFDDFRYKVEYKVDGQTFATHIINERPKYDYENKTCTFYLGNDLDNLDTLPTSVYPYPKKSYTLYDVFVDLMEKIFGMDTEDSIDLILSNHYNSDITYKQYFSSIQIDYPYLSSTNAREALKTILLITQCGLCKDKNNNFQIVRLDGYADGTNLTQNVYLIEPQHINKGFVPSVILNNKYDVFDVPYYNAEKNLYYGEEIFKKEYKLEDLTTETTPDLVSTPSYDIGYTHQGDDQLYVAAVQINEDKTTFNFSEIILRDQNNNLVRVEEIFESLKKENANPSISILANKKITKYDAKFYVSSVNNSFNYNVTSTSYKTESTEEIYFDTLETAIAIDAFTYTGLSPNKLYSATVNLEEIVLKNNASLVKRKVGANKFELELQNYLCGIKGERVYGTKFTQQGGVGEAGTYTGIKEIIEIIPKSITIIVKGTVYKIEFKETSGSYTNEKKPTNNYTLQKPLELLQVSEHIDENTSDLISTISNNLLNAFNGGIHTGELTVIRGDYRQKENDTITKNKLFEIGDKVMPCKDYNKTPIVTRGVGKAPVIFQVVDVETYGEGGALFQNLKLREIKELT